MGELSTEQNWKLGSPSRSCFWGKAAGCHDVSASGKKLFSYSPSGRWVKSGCPQQLSWCFSQAPCSREYKWRNWDMTFSLIGKVSADNEWTSLRLQALLGKKKTNFKCRGNKNTPSPHFILSLWTNAVLVFKTTFQMVIQFLNRKSTVLSIDRKITASSYYLVIWKIVDWGNKVLHWRAWVISCRQKKQNQISVKPTFTPKPCEHPTWVQ